MGKCTKGKFKEGSGKSNDDEQKYTWGCEGENGGTTDESCSIKYLTYHFKNPVGTVSDNNNDANIAFSTSYNYKKGDCGFQRYYDENETDKILHQGETKDIVWDHDCYEVYYCSKTGTISYDYYNNPIEGLLVNDTDCEYKYTVQGLMTEQKYNDLALELISGSKVKTSYKYTLAGSSEYTLQGTSDLSQYVIQYDPNTDKKTTLTISTAAEEKDGDHYSYKGAKKNIGTLVQPNKLEDMESNKIGLQDWWGYYRTTVTNKGQMYVVYIVYDLFSPILLDLAGIGVPDVAYGNWLPHPEQFDYNRAKVFDMTGEGYFMLTEWVAPNSGILCTLDDNGKVSSALELFGTAGGWSDGYAKLSKLFDKDKNGIVEREELDGLYVWHDRNMDAVSDPDELKPVGEWGITKIWARHDKYRSIFERNGKHYYSWDWWPSATLIKPEDRNELLKGADIRKMHFKVRPMDGEDVRKLQQNQTQKQKAKDSIKAKMSSFTEKHNKADRKTDPIQLPYMIATAAEYSTYHKKKKGWSKNGRGVFGS